MSNDETRRALAELSARAATDAFFRARLVADPHATARSVGVELPAALRVAFAERPAGVDHWIHLPDAAGASPELSDEELQGVAGGCVCLSDEKLSSAFQDNL